MELCDISWVVIPFTDINRTKVIFRKFVRSPIIHRRRAFISQIPFVQFNLGNGITS